jgi:hypothetical protein
MDAPRFKLTRATISKPADPSSLFKSLKIRSKVIKRAWDNQAESWRQYFESFGSASDVAIEMPTGSGKTLVGLVIAEYRRLRFDERVVYLCPTRQLCRQVGAVADECGIKAAVCLAPDYTGLSDFKQSQCVAITTYSSLFNTKPKFDKSEVILLDDAHSAENYIADLWSLNLTRSNHPNLFRQLIGLLSDDLDDYSRGQLLDDDCSPRDKWHSHSIPITSIADKEKAIRDLIEQGLSEKDPQRYSWSIIKMRLHACQAYISWHEILLRPFIPPTLTHSPFASAKQRIYMSATLGNHGELERIVGVPKIQRIAATDGESSGRRLILFPEAKLSSAQSDTLMKAVVKMAERALVLTPSNRESNSVTKRLQECGVNVLQAQDVEEDLSSFCEKKNVALVLANRYDGIDLPDDSCRLLILNGAPIGTNLQERFLFSHLGAGALLVDRMRTRLTQGFGRCCRNANDYAAVLLLGEELRDFCFDHLVKRGLNEDIQAELRFGLLQEDELKTETDYAGLVRLLLENGEQWEAAEELIAQIRAEISLDLVDSNNVLPKTAESEVNFIYALWDKKFSKAAQESSKVADQLHNFKEAQTYRAWWLYLSACAQWLEGMSTNDETNLKKAKVILSHAGELCTGITWFPELVRKLAPEEPCEIDLESRRACKKIYDVLTELGFTGQKFEKVLQQMLEQLEKTEAVSFELGLLKLGEILGFDSVRPNEKASPDSIWRHEDQFVLSFEAKSEESQKDPVSYDTVRQVSFQPKWIRTNLSVGNSIPVHAILVTPRRTIDRIARDEAGEICIVHVDDIRQLAHKAASALRRIRAKGGTFVSDSTINEIYATFSAEELLPKQVLAELRAKPLQDLKIAKGT